MIPRGLTEYPRVLSSLIPWGTQSHLFLLSPTELPAACLFQPGPLYFIIKEEEHVPWNVCFGDWKKNTHTFFTAWEVDQVAFVL